MFIKYIKCIYAHLYVLIYIYIYLGTQISYYITPQMPVRVGVWPGQSQEP